MLEFICGAASCGKSDEIYRRAKVDAQRGKNVYILVPEQYSLYAEQEMLDRMGLMAQNKIQILTFSRLCNIIFARKGPLRIKYADKAGKYMLTRKAISSAEKELSQLKPNVKQHGFAKLVSSSISEFKRYGISHDFLFSFADKIDDLRLKYKLLDLSIIYKNFDSLIAKGYSNSEDNLELIINKIPGCDFLSGVFYVDFFRSFTPTEYDVLAEIMKKSDVCVSLCTNTLSDDSGVFCTQVRTYNKLLNLAKKINVDIGNTFFVQNEENVPSSNEIAHLRENFFSANPAPLYGAPKSVHILRPDDFYSEVFECATLITRLCRTEGKSLNDFLILTGNMENYESILPPLFEKFGIKYFLDRKVVLTESPLMRAIISALEILAFGFSYERIMSILRSGYFNCTREAADTFENYILATGVSHKHWLSRDPWQYNPNNLFDMEIINSVREAIVFPILDFANMFAGRKTISQICEGLFLWLSKIEMPEIINKKIAEFSASQQPERAEQLRLVWNSLVSVSCQMSECLGKDFASFTEFYELFTSSCAELSVGTIPLTQDKVVISEAEHFRSTGNKVVIVLGVCDRVFPRSHMSEGIISDSERVLLANTGLELAPDEYNRQKEDRFLIYSLFATASEQLYLLSPKRDKDGKALLASEVVLKIKNKLFPDIEFCHSSKSVSAKELESRQNIFEFLVSKLFEKNWDFEKLDSSWQAAYSYFSKSPAFSHRLNTLFAMNSRKGEPDVIKKTTAEKLYGAPLFLSVSKLEKYNSCAFSFFMRYGLIAKERLLSGFKAADMGSVLHAVLCDYFKDKTEKSINYSEITHADCTAEINSLVEKYATLENDGLYVSSWHYKYITMRMKSIAASTAWKMVCFYSQSNFKPKGFEVSFGKKGVLPPYELSTSFGPVFLEGFVDRIDEMTLNGETYISISDYKSSEKKLNTSLVAAGVRFQPLIYANAICNEVPHLHAAGMFYMHMNDPVLKFDTLPSETTLKKEMFSQIKIHGMVLNIPEVIEGFDSSFNDKDAIHYLPGDKNSLLTQFEFDKYLKDAKEKAISSAEKIISGDISINPLSISEFDSCSYCPYTGVCNKK